MKWSGGSRQTWVIKNMLNEEDINAAENQAKVVNDKSPSPIQVLGSVFAAAFGVQSKKNRERDFQHGRFLNFAIGGAVFTLVFLVSIYLLVSVVLADV